MLIGLHGAVLIAMNLLAVAFAAACSSRCRKPFWRWFWPILMALVMLSSVLTAVFGGFLLLQQNVAPHWFFGFFLGLFIVSAVGAVVVMVLGLRAVSTPWRRWPLAVLLALAAILNLMVLEQMQSRSMQQLSYVQSEAAGYLLLAIPAQVPPSANAHPLYERAIGLLGEGDGLPGWFAESVEPGTEPDHPVLRAFMADQADVLDLVAQAAALPEFRPPLNGLNYYEWPTPDLTGYRRLAILLVLAARDAALSGDAQVALERLDQLRRMARHIAQGPVLISHVLADSIDSMRLRSLEYLMATREIPSAALKGLLAPPMALSSLERFHRALCREAQGLLHGFTVTAATPDIHALDGQNPSPLGAPNAVTRMWRAYFLPDDLRAARDIITRQMCLPVDSFTALEANLAVIGAARDAGQMGILSAIGAPDFSDAVSLAMRHDALEKLGALALAATVFRDARGHWPTDLEALIPDFIPAVPIDPFDGQPLKLKASDGGIELYSVGPPPTDGNADPVRFCLGQPALMRYRIHPPLDVNS